MQVQPEIIQGIFALGTTIFSALMAHSQVNRKRLKEKLKRAEQDIAFLLAVEKEYGERNQKLVKASFKNRVRSEVLAQGYTWSGNFTPGRVRASASREASSFTTTVSAHAIVLTKRAAHAIAAGARWTSAKIVAITNRSVRRFRGKGAASEAAI